MFPASQLLGARFSDAILIVCQYRQGDGETEAAELAAEEQTSEERAGTAR
jgi:hypothetical protein